MVYCWSWGRGFKPRIYCLLSGNLILDHPPLVVCLSSIASQQLEEAVQEHRLEVLDKEWSQRGEVVFDTCLWISQAFAVKPLLVDLSPAR